MTLAATLPYDPLKTALAARICPMSIWINDSGGIESAGRTMQKLLDGMDPDHNSFFGFFSVRSPTNCNSMSDMRALDGQIIRLSINDAHGLTVRGEVVALADAVFLNLSFGFSLIEAVRAYGLTSADFAESDLAIEFLFLTEARSLAMSMSRKLNMRLHVDKLTAENEAQTDSLTGLLNRRAMQRMVDMLICNEQEFGVLHVDLDYFKQVNDTLGHAAGDEVLKTVAMRLTEETKPHDAVIRTGGDEFIILLIGVIESEVLSDVGSRLIKLIEQPIPYDGHMCQISASIGATLSCWYAHADITRIIDDSDQALYEAKRSGRAGVVVHNPLSLS